MHLAVPRQLPFGEDAHDLILLQFRCDFIECGFQHRRIFQRAGDWDHLAVMKDTIDNRHVKVFVVHYEASRPGATARNDETVHEGDMIARDDEGAFRRKILPTNDFEAVDYVREPPRHEAQQKLRYQGVYIYSDEHVQQRQDEKYLGEAEVVMVE